MYRTFDFYFGDWRPMLTNEEIAKKLEAKEIFYLFTNEEGKVKLEEEFMFKIEHQRRTTILPCLMANLSIQKQGIKLMDTSTC